MGLGLEDNGKDQKEETVFKVVPSGIGDLWMPQVTLVYFIVSRGIKRASRCPVVLWWLGCG